MQANLKVWISTSKYDIILGTDWLREMKAALGILENGPKYILINNEKFDLIKNDITEEKAHEKMNLIKDQEHFTTQITINGTELEAILD